MPCPAREITFSFHFNFITKCKFAHYLYRLKYIINALFVEKIISEKSNEFLKIEVILKVYLQ